jgi:hypothetical protein
MALKVPNRRPIPLSVPNMSLQEFRSKNTLRKLWWLHDSFWHAALIREMGPEEANRINLEVSEKIFRMLTNMLLRERIIQRPDSIQDLMQIFKVVWKNAFFDDLYIHEPIEYKGNTAVWIGTRCHAFDSLNRAGLLSGYECGCQALRNGVMKALRLKPLHQIRENLIRGDDRCVIELSFERKGK